MNLVTRVMTEGDLATQLARMAALEALAETAFAAVNDGIQFTGGGFQCGACFGFGAHLVGDAGVVHRDGCRVLRMLRAASVLAPLMKEIPQDERSAAGSEAAVASSAVGTAGASRSIALELSPSFVARYWMDEADVPVREVTHEERMREVAAGAAFPLEVCGE